MRAGLRRVRVGGWLVGALVVTVGLTMAWWSPRSSQAATRPAWLTTINYWRAAAGLPAVRNNPVWDRGLLNHFIYLKKSPARYISGRYASLHTENPASPYYTASGAKEAGSSDLAQGVSSSGRALDEWLAAPFHTIGMLRPNLTEVALAVRDGFGGLDVISGLDGGFQSKGAILYPGPGSTTRLLEFGGEDPDPTQTCGWQGQRVGLPLIVMLQGKQPSKRLSATLHEPGGARESSGARTLCVVDQFTFRTTNKIYGPNALEILQHDNAVLLIPHRPLVPGNYSVSVAQPGQNDISWSFHAATP